LNVLSPVGQRPMANVTHALCGLSLYHHAIMIHQTIQREAGAGLPTASHDDDRHVSFTVLRQGPNADDTNEDLDNTELQMKVLRSGNTHAFWRLSQSESTGLQRPRCSKTLDARLSQPPSGWRMMVLPFDRVHLEPMQLSEAKVAWHFYASHNVINEARTTLRRCCTSTAHTSR
jgi:hypothetical protein